MIALWHRLPTNFEHQLDAIGYRAEAYHFDDGHDDVLRAAEGLEAMALRGVFFVITERIGTPGYVTEPMLRELVSRGHEVGNHTHTHRFMNRLGAMEVRDDIATAQDILTATTGITPTRLAWPSGRHSAVSDSVARAFGFVEVRDISNVVHYIAKLNPLDLQRLFA